jgi:hypothetical protein
VREYIDGHLALGEYVHALALISQFKVRGYTVTHSTAKKEYKLKERQLKYMQFAEVQNPHYKTGAPMKLYLIRQLKKFISVMEKHRLERQ